VDESCDLVVEALDLARGDAVFEKVGDCRNFSLKMYSVEIFALRSVSSAGRANPLLSMFSHPATSGKREPLITSFPSAFRAAPLEGGQRNPYRIPVGQGQLIDGDFTGTDFLESRLAVRTARLATAVTKHRDVHSGFFH